MTETSSADPHEILLGKISKMIADQTAGTPSGFSAENLQHVYLDLVQGSVCETSNDLLIKMIGPDWADGFEPSEEDFDDVASEAKNMALAESIESIDETDPREAVNTLASALMVACRELGWLEASRAAHDQWFHAGVDD